MFKTDSLTLHFLLKLIVVYFYFIFQSDGMSIHSNQGFCPVDEPGMFNDIFLSFTSKKNNLKCGTHDREQ